MGFAILMFGMESMSACSITAGRGTGVYRISDQHVPNPESSVCWQDAVLTAVIQSSSASVGILQALCVTGAVSYGVAIPIIMGQNIGTCVTALIIRVSEQAKMQNVPLLVHLYFNIIGTVVFMVIFYSVNAVVAFSFLGTGGKRSGNCSGTQSALMYAATLVLLPFSKGLEKLACLTIRDDAKSLEEEEEKTRITASGCPFSGKTGICDGAEQFMWQIRWRRNPNVLYLRRWILPWNYCGGMSAKAEQCSADWRQMVDQL